MLKLLIISILAFLIYFVPWEFLCFCVILLAYKVLYPQLFSRITLIHSQSSYLKSILSSCKSLQGPYRPPIYLFNGFLQGVFGMTLGSRPGQSIFCDSVEYTREFLTLPDNGEISIDWLHSKNSKTILIVAPGLGSHSQSQSARSVALEAHHNSMTVAIIHGRGVSCKIKSPLIFSLCVWEDYEFAIKHIHTKNPSCQLVGLGMSMGGTALINYACRSGKNCLIRALALVASPMDCKFNSIALGSQWNYFGFFDKLILKVLKMLIKQAESELNQWKDLLEHKGINFKDIYESESCYEFDDLFTAKMLGLENAQKYYEKGSCEHLVKNICIPVLAIHAKDDPIVSYLAVPRQEFEKNENMVLALTSTGGHVGFFRGFFPPKRWFQVPCIEFLSQCLSHKYD